LPHCCYDCFSSPIGDRGIEGLYGWWPLKIYPKKCKREEYHGTACGNGRNGETGLETKQEEAGQIEASIRLASTAQAFWHTSFQMRPDFV